MKSHEIEYQIFGDDLQFVEIKLDPGETVVGEAGAMMYMNPGITFETKMGDGSEPEASMFSKLKSAGKRMLAQESLFLTHFTNQAQQPSSVSFAAEFPGKIVAADLAQLKRQHYLPEGLLFVCSFGYSNRHRFQSQYRHRSVWRRRLHFAATSRRRLGVSVRGRNYRAARLARRDAQSRYRLPGGLYRRHSIRH